ncbi:MAG TPA: tetratricopeptide repeat protein [Acidimicrobiales bacterium]|nr:tetratricopeptide repeat protein [Acidimicrobiales bacterium]
MEVDAEVRRAAGDATAAHRETLVRRLHDAAASYQRHRDADALRLAKSVAREVPSVAAVHEVAGLAAYRSGQWREAIRQLETHFAMTDEVADLPMLMDAQRAVGKHKKVADLWGELRRRSPEPGVLAEARIVAAGSLADRGDLDGAISLLAAAGAAKARRNPSERHLRQWYALADLYERAGDFTRARELFLLVARADPDAYDVADRLEALGPARRRPRSRTRGAPPARRTSGTG